MDHTQIEAENVVERYLMGRLSAEELGRFEEHYLDCPRCLDQLELGRRLHRGLKQVAAEHGAHPHRGPVAGWWARRSPVFRGPVFRGALAAGLLAALILPWIVDFPRSVGPDPALAPRAQSPTYLLGQERSSAGEGPSAVVSVRPFPEWLALAPELPPFEDSTSFRVRLLVAGSEGPLWEGQLESEGDGRVRLQVHSSWLEPGLYTLELGGLDAEGNPGTTLSFPFRVRRGE